MATLKTNITADASQFLKVIKDVLKSAEQAQKAITDAFNENADIKIDDSGIKSAIDEVSRLEKELSGLSGGVKIDDSEVKKTQKTLKDIDGTTLNVDVETSGLSGLTDAFSGALAGGVLGGGLAGLATAGLEAVVSGFSDAIALGNEFNTALGDLQAKTGATAEEMKALEQASKDAFLGGVGESVAEATQILGNTQIRLGDIFSTKEISDFTAQAQALATTFDLDVNEVVTKATPLIKQYGLSAQEAFETIAFSLQNGANAQDDILDSFAEYSQLAQEAGFSAQELGILISQAGEDGAFNTDKLVDSLKEAQIRINAGDYKDAFKGLQEGADEAQKGVISSVEAIIQKADSGELSIKDALALSTKEIEEAYDSGLISDAIRSQLQVAIAGTPAEDLGADLYAKAFGATIPQDVIDQQFQEAGASISNAIGQYTSFDAVTRQFELVITEISQGLISFSDTVLAPLIGGVIEIVSGVKDAFDSVFGDFELGGVTDELSGLLDVFNIIVGFLKDRVEATFRAVFGFIRSVIESVQDVFRPLIELVGELANSFGGAGSIFEDFGDIMKDVGDIIGLVGGLIFDLLITPLEFTINILADVITEFLEFIGVLGDTGESGSFVSDVLNFIKEALENIKGTIGGVVSAFDALKDALTSLDLGKIVQDLLSGKNPFEGITDQIEDAYDKGFNKATGKFEDALDDQIEANSKAYEQISKDIETLANNRANLSNKELANEKRKLQGIIDSNLEANELIKQDAIKLENQLGQIKVVNSNTSTNGIGAVKEQLKDLSDIILGKTDLKFQLPNFTDELQIGGIDDLTEAITGLKIKDENLATIDSFIDGIDDAIDKVVFLQTNLESSPQFIAKLAEENEKLTQSLLSQTDVSSKTIEAIQSNLVDLKLSFDEAGTEEERQRIASQILIANQQLQDEIVATAKKRGQDVSTIERSLAIERLKIEGKTTEEINELLNKQLEDLNNKKDEAIEIRKEQANQTIEVVKEEVKKEASLLEDLAVLFAQSVASYDPQGIIDRNKDVENSINSVKEELRAETKELEDQLLDREISYAEYNRKLVELEEEKNGKIKELEKERFDFIDTINDQLAQSFENLNDTLKELLVKRGQDFADQAEKDAETQAELTEFVKESAGVAVATIGSALGQAIAEGDNLFQALIKSTISTAQVLLNAWAAPLLLKANTERPLGLGTIEFGLLLAGANALLATAQAGIGGANDGVIGLNESNKGKPKGNDSILMMLAPNESVITASGTNKNKPYLEFINKGGSIADLINPNVYSSDMSETNKRIDETNRRLQGLEQSFRRTKVEHGYFKEPTLNVNNTVNIKSRIPSGAL